MSSPEVLRQALLLDNAYFSLFFGSAVATSTLGLWLLRRARARALLSGGPGAWGCEAPRRAADPAHRRAGRLGAGRAAAQALRGQRDLRRRLGRERRRVCPHRHAG